MQLKNRGNDRKKVKSKPINKVYTCKLHIILKTWTQDLNVLV